MVYYTNNWRIYLLGLAASLVIFGVVFFTVIKPNSDTANQAVKAGVQQAQQAAAQFDQAAGQTGTVSSQPQGPATTGHAERAINSAARLATCVSDAGTDVAKIQSCQVKFSH
jgi:flagellar biosynthesis/type III secretory pathway M-ring protein FliF/YscJ